MNVTNNILALIFAFNGIMDSVNDPSFHSFVLIGSWISTATLFWVWMNFEDYYKDKKNQETHGIEPPISIL